MSVSIEKSNWCETWFNTAKHVYFDTAATLEGWWWRLVFAAVSFLFFPTTVVFIPPLRWGCIEPVMDTAIFSRSFPSVYRRKSGSLCIYRRPTIWNFAAVFLNRMHSRNFVFHERKILVFFCKFFKHVLNLWKILDPLTGRDTFQGAKNKTIQGW